MADFGLAIELQKDQEKGLFGELHNSVMFLILTLLKACHRTSHFM